MRRFSLPGEGGIDAFYEPIGATQSFDTSAAPRMPRSDTSSSQTWFSESRTDGATLKCHGSATNLLKRPTTEGLFCHLEALEFCWRVELGVWRGYRDQLRDSDQIEGEQVKHELGDHAGAVATLVHGAVLLATALGHRPRSREYRETRRMLICLRSSGISTQC